MGALGSRRGEATALRHLAISLRRLGDPSGGRGAVPSRPRDLEGPRRSGGDRPRPHHTRRHRPRVRGSVQRRSHLRRGVGRAAGDRRRSLPGVHVQEPGHDRRRSATSTTAPPSCSGAPSLSGIELGDEAGLAEVLEGLAGVSSASGRDEDVATFLAAASMVRERTGSAASPTEAGAAAGCWPPPGAGWPRPVRRRRRSRPGDVAAGDRRLRPRRRRRQRSLTTALSDHTTVGSRRHTQGTTWPGPRSTRRHT